MAASTRYSMASNVNVSSFLSGKLYSRKYKIWKARMLNLIESQGLLQIINAEHSSRMDESVIEDVDMISKFDKLVKDWILSTLNEDMLKDVKDLGTAREVWMKLETICIPPRTHTEVGDPVKEHYKEYLRALRVTISTYVSVKISGRGDYHIWKSQMLYIIELEKLLHIIIAEYPFPENKGVHMISKYDKLIKGWIYSTMEDQLLNDFLDYSSVQSIWRELESRFNRPISYREEGDSVHVLTQREDLKYIQVSAVNVSNFVSVRLSGYNNYPLWKAQMTCLLASQELFHIINVEDGTVWSGPMNNKYDKLVLGWILGTMNDRLFKTFKYYNSAHLLWSKLYEKFRSTEISKERAIVAFRDSPGSDSDSDSDRICDTADATGFTFRKALITEIPELQITTDLLYRAAVEGNWGKAKSILKDDIGAATMAITHSRNTILHLAVERGHDNFVEKLLVFLKDAKDIKTRNKEGRTALHIAVMANNLHVAQLLVQKGKELLKIKDRYKMTPLDIANANKKLNISTYLLKCMILDTDAEEEETLGSDAVDATHAIQAAIYTKQYDLTGKLLEKIPISAKRMKYILMALTVTFPTDLSSVESFIYPSFNNVRWKTFLRDFLLFQRISVDDILPVMKICNNTCCTWSEKVFMILLVPIATLYPIYQVICLLFRALRLTFSMMYFLLWKILVATVRPVKNIEKKKTEYEEAKVLLRLICQMDIPENGCRKAILEAVRQDTYEVVDEILFKSPRTIHCGVDEDYHNVIQLAIINRSEKVYKLIHHIIHRLEDYRTMTDHDGNNLVHLAGRLAPPFVLNRTTGAALQLQRELIWQEEVEKLMLPLELKRKNKNGETPAEVFTEQHRDLMKQGEAWMKTTAESCSITAALIITIVFAAAITVPGGSDQKSGIPVFKKEIAFSIFAVFNAFSLFTAATSLLLFLSILTARFSERDFLVSLPRRLILGLLTLFLSTTAMIVAFGAILFLVFCDQRPWMLAPICVMACLPISVIVIIKLPLLVDLIRSTYIPIFGKRSYLESCKINTKNTTFY